MKQIYFKYRKTVLLLVATFSLTLIFQNCADPLELSETDASTFSNSLPFAYDMKADTFAYMSCNTNSSTYDSRAVFTFRVGAYAEGSGIKLSDEFLSATKSLSEATKLEALQKSTMNSGAILQMAVRNTSVDYQQILLNTSGAVQLGKDVENFLAGSSLDAPGIASRLIQLKEGERIRYFNSTPGLDGRFLEQSLRFNEVLKSVTEKMVGSTGSRVTLAYTRDNDPLSYFARGPSESTLSRSIFGTEFRATFTAPTSRDGTTLSTASDRNRILHTLGSVNIINKSTTTETMWSCPAEYRYMIVRPEDNVDPSPLNGKDNRVCPLNNWSYDHAPEGREKELEVLRRVIRVEDYYVNMARRCIVPKDSANVCYPTDAETMDIQYLGTSCNDDPKNGVYQCPNFVSVCVRPTE